MKHDIKVSKKEPSAPTKGHRAPLDGPSRDNVKPIKVSKMDAPWPAEKRAKL